MAEDFDLVQPRLRIDLTYTVQMAGSLAIYSGFPRGIVDRTVVRGLDGLPYIPASTIKGRVRDMAEKLARAQGIPTCDGPDPKTMCPGKQATPGQFCLICRTFGAPGYSSRSGQTGLVWRDAHLLDSADSLPKENQDWLAHSLFYQRTQVQISRPRGVALAKHLFTSENTIENLVFQGRIRGWAEQDYIEGTNIPDTLVFLCAALKLLNFIGGSKSRGLGRCTVEIEGKIEIGDRKLEPKEVLKHVDSLGSRT